MRLDRLLDDRSASWAFRLALVVSIPVYYVAGRRQWFMRDDWAFVLTRDQIRRQFGWDEWLFIAQDGHWLTPPLIAYRLIESAFGLGSYWPFLLPVIALHVAAVLLVRVLCHRVGVTEWTTTLLCTVLLWFGGGWENIVFAVQITYNLSLVAFLAQLVLVDHEGRPDHRDAIGAALGVIGVMSSGFGPFFIVGVALVLLLRRRWFAAAIAVIPQGLAYGWWAVNWGADVASNEITGPRTLAPAFAVRGIVATFERLVAIPSLAGVAIVGSLAVVLVAGRDWRTRSMLVTLWMVPTMMFVGIGVQRIGFGLDSAASSRYLHVAAMFMVPLLGLAVDRLQVWSMPVFRAAQVVLVVSVVLNAGWLHVDGGSWARRAAESRRTYELLAGSPLTATVDPSVVPVPFDPDVTVGRIAEMVERGAIEPRSTSTPDDEALVRRALGLPPP